jgi:hypothetical protein
MGEVRRSPSRDVTEEWGQRNFFILLCPKFLCQIRVLPFPAQAFSPLTRPARDSSEFAPVSRSISVFRFNSEWKQARRLCYLGNRDQPSPRLPSISDSGATNAAKNAARTERRALPTNLRPSA